MQFFPPKIFLLIAILLPSAACVDPSSINQNSNNGAGNSVVQTEVNANANVAKDDVAELERIINLPFEPDESSVWRESNVPEKGRKLVAILKFTPDETAEIVKSAESLAPAVPAVLDVEDWYPPELIAQGLNSGDKTIKGNSYAAKEFLKTPFTGGKLTRIDNTDFFVLELTAF